MSEEQTAPVKRKKKRRKAGAATAPRTPISARLRRPKGRPIAVFLSPSQAALLVRTLSSVRGPGPTSGAVRRLLDSIVADAFASR